MAKQIKIYKGNEFKIFSMGKKIERSDIFFEQYQRAWKSVEEIAKYAFDERNSGKKTMFNSEYLNNIVAFCGERGQGKSSAMYAFMNELYSNRNDSELYSEYGTRYETRIYQTEFVPVDIIDPASFNNNSSILEIVISRIFKQYQKAMDKCTNQVDCYEQRETLDLFNKVYESITLCKDSSKLTNQDCNYGNGIQQLGRLEEAADLREDISNLISNVLKVFCKNSTASNHMLVISIDDLDISIDVAYTMAEQIRKFLIVPNILIVMALRVEQLKYCVEKEFVHNLESLQKTKPEIIKEETEQMAGRYIDKLIPIARRFYLPKINVLAREGVEIQYINDGQKVFDNRETSDLNIFVLRMIYEKTGLVFYPRHNELHILVPNNLRELVSLLALLDKMDSVEVMNPNEVAKDLAFYMKQSLEKSLKHGNTTELANITDKRDQTCEDTICKIEKYYSNLLLFKNYFLHTWAVNHLDGEHLLVLEKLVELPVNQQHKYICNQLIKSSDMKSEDQLDIFGYGDSISPEKTLEKTLTEKILKNKNLGYSEFSLADSLNVLSHYAANNNTPQVEYFIASIKTLFTIEMHEMLYHKQNVIDHRNELNQFIGDRIWSKVLQDKMLPGEGIKTNSRAFYTSEATEISSVDWKNQAAFINYIVKEDKDIYYKMKRREAFSSNRNLKHWIFALDNILLSFADLEYSFYIARLGGNKTEKEKEREEYYNYLLKSEGFNFSLCNMLILITNIELLEGIVRRCDESKGAIKETASNTNHYINYVDTLTEILKSVKCICCSTAINFSVFNSECDDIEKETKKVSEIFSKIKEISNFKDYSNIANLQDITNLDLQLVTYMELRQKRNELDGIIYSFPEDIKYDFVELKKNVGRSKDTTSVNMEKVQEWNNLINRINEHIKTEKKKVDAQLEQQKEDKQKSEDRTEAAATKESDTFDSNKSKN